jgi:hypothetical protein
MNSSSAVIEGRNVQPLLDDEGAGGGQPTVRVSSNRATSFNPKDAIFPGHVAPVARRTALVQKVASPCLAFSSDALAQISSGLGRDEIVVARPRRTIGP